MIPRDASSARHPFSFCCHIETVCIFAVIKYEAPQVTVVTFKTERGFAGSNDFTGVKTVLIGARLSSGGGEGTYVDRTDYGEATTGTWY